MQTHIKPAGECDLGGFELHGSPTKQPLSASLEDAQPHPQPYPGQISLTWNQLSGLLEAHIYLCFWGLAPLCNSVLSRLGPQEAFTI
jgi:hypothetical protein